MLTDEYQLWLAVRDAGTPDTSARGARTPGGAGTGMPPGGAIGPLPAGQELARLTAQLTEREMHVLDALCDPEASQQAPGAAPAPASPPRSRNPGQRAGQAPVRRKTRMHG